MGASSAPAFADGLPGDRHCTATPYLETDTPLDVALPAPEIICYPTLSEAIFASTGGAVNLPTDATQDQVDFALQNQAGTRVVLSIDFEDRYFNGSSLTWSFDNGVGCSQGKRFASPRIRDSWDNRISSARTYSGCVRNPHYQLADYGGASAPCECYDIGALNDRTTSIRWRPAS